VKYSPIVLFVYNRISHTRQTVEALKQNHLAGLSDLIIYSDGHKTNDKESFKVFEVRKYLKKITGFRSIKIIERKKNLGLAESIINGVTSTLNKYDKIIVLEDDLVTSQYFLNFMNDALNSYVDDDDVCCIHGYSYPIKNINSDFFIKGADCWGWATWKKAWNFFEKDSKKLLEELKRKNLHKDRYNLKCGYTKMLKDQIDGKNNSWAIRWYFSAYLNDLYCLYPKKSFVNNIGFDGSGTNCDQTNKYQNSINEDYNFNKEVYIFNKIDIVENEKVKLKIINFLKPESFFLRLINFLKKIIN